MKRYKGLSYIEIIIFIVILGLAIPPLLTITADTYNKSINVETMHIATNLAHQKMEDIIGRDFDSVVTEAAAYFPGQFSEYQYRVDVDYVQSGDLGTPVVTPTFFKRVSVVVYDPGSGGRTITFTTVVSND